MQAVVSGRSGVAVLLEGDEIRSLHAETGEIVHRREREIPYLLGDATDLQFLEDVEIPDVAQQLEVATAQADALHLALLLLDRQLPHDIRRDAADELAELLEIAGVRESVEGVLLAHPLPMEADLTGALSSCPGRAEASRALLLHIQALQSEVRDVFDAWEQIPDRVFGEERNRSCALSVAIREGFFRQLVILRAEHRPVDGFLIEALRNAAFSRARNHRGILHDWFSPLREPKSSVPVDVDFDPGAQFVAEGAEPHVPCLVTSDEEDTALRVWDLDIDRLLAAEVRVAAPVAGREAERAGQERRKRDKVFISYSHQDREWLDRLRTMLAPLIRDGSISPWDDTTIRAGAKWKEEIEAALASAQVAVLLVSDHFLASEFIAQEELPPLLAAAKQDDVPILWVYVSTCFYEATPINDYQVAFSISRTLAEMNEAECKRALKAICKRIKEAAALEGRGHPP